jgi:RNA polymerase sigma-70 factor (ECF subfamily)
MAEAEAEALWADVCRGDERAFAAVYDRFGPALFRTAWALVGSRELAEDCVQDVFVALVRVSRQGTRIDNLRGYLFAALRHRAARCIPRGPAVRSLEDAAEPAAPWQQDAGSAVSEHLHRALDRLPAEQREVVILKTQGELTFAEIAGLLSISANTAASRYRYALEKLRAALQEEPHV